MRRGGLWGSQHGWSSGEVGWSCIEADVSSRSLLVEPLSRTAQTWGISARRGVFKGLGIRDLLAGHVAGAAVPAPREGAP